MRTPPRSLAPGTDMEPGAFLRLAAHPLRWRLLAELARSDRVVSELTARLDQPQSLVSYHLAKLRDSRLVFARRSSADRRDTYYGLDLNRVTDLFSAAGHALHPGLRVAPVAPGVGTGPARVLFLCTGNSARSPMAEALLRSRSAGMVQACSAGSQPRPLHPNAVRVLQDGFGIDLSGHAPRHLDEFAGQRFDWVISLCDRVREVCPGFPGQPAAVHWSIVNPATGEPDDVTLPLFRRTAQELAGRIDYLLAAIRSHSISASSREEP